MAFVLLLAPAVVDLMRDETQQVYYEFACHDRPVMAVLALAWLTHRRTEANNGSSKQSPMRVQFLQEM